MLRHVSKTRLGTGSHLEHPGANRFTIPEWLSRCIARQCDLLLLLLLGATRGVGTARTDVMGQRCSEHRPDVTTRRVGIESLVVSVPLVSASSKLI